MRLPQLHEGMNFCFLDIETAPMESLHFSPKTEFVPYAANEQGFTILCAAWSFSGSEKAYSSSIQQYFPKPTYSTVRKDKKVVADLVELLTHCAEHNVVVVTQNGDRFDIPKIKARGAIHRLPAIPKFTSIDTLKLARQLGFDYKNLDYLDKMAGGEGKLANRGWALWSECVSRHSSKATRLKALKEMLEYNIMDIPPLVRVLAWLAPYCDRMPNINLWQGTEDSCPSCGSDNVIFRSKPYIAATRMYRRKSCNDCGKWFREASCIKGVSVKARAA
tara:strand:- start:329 stop:1156 length:828 start_codon:yes stop_codon:yes gene_type:complete